MTWLREFIATYRWNRRYGKGGGLPRSRSLINAWRWMRDWRHQRAYVWQPNVRDVLEASERALADAERIIEGRTGKGSWVGSLVLARVRDVLSTASSQDTKPQ